MEPVKGDRKIISVPSEQVYVMQTHATKFFIKAQDSLVLSSVSCKKYGVFGVSDRERGGHLLAGPYANSLNMLLLS